LQVIFSRFEASKLVADCNRVSQGTSKALTF
jgi:hypothetical protein